VEDAKDGVNRTALREIKLLIELDHENIIALFGITFYKIKKKNLDYTLFNYIKFFFRCFRSFI
jgi:hypothetical protein